MMHRPLLRELAPARIRLLTAHGSDGGPIRGRQSRPMTEGRGGLPCTSLGVRQHPTLGQSRLSR